MARRPPFLPIYSYEADNEKGTTFQWKIHERDTFVKNSIYKGKGLDLGAKPLRAKLYWVASHPPPLFPRAFHKLLGNVWQLLVFRATFCIISEQFLSLVFFQFWDIWAALSASLGLASILHSVLVDNLWTSYEKGAKFHPLGGGWWAHDAAELLGQRFFWTKRQNGGLRFTLDWHECLRWRRSFNNFNGSY